MAVQIVHQFGTYKMVGIHYRLLSEGVLRSALLGIDNIEFLSEIISIVSTSFTQRVPYHKPVIDRRCAESFTETRQSGQHCDYIYCQELLVTSLEALEQRLGPFIDQGKESASLII